jgi:hypothetical protein
MVCAMNITEQVSSSKVFEDANPMQGAYGGEDEETIVSDKACKIAERLCQRAGLKQVMLSLNIPVEAVQMMSHDMKLGLMLEKGILDAIK